jgi:hypothetical protein
MWKNLIKKFNAVIADTWGVWLPFLIGLLIGLLW